MGIQLAQANSIRIPLADESVHCCITSPPFFGLRDYGLPPVVWGHERCWHGGEHEWGEKLTASDGLGQTLGGPKSTLTGSQIYGEQVRKSGQPSQGQFCQHCHAWRGSLGLEPSPDLYVAHLVEVFREVRRVLRSDGVVWLNLGMSYAGANYRGGGPETASKKQVSNAGTLDFMARSAPPIPAGYKPKDLIPAPWLVALALQKDGWWLRSAPPWLKKNCLPESVRDRPTTAHEYWFLLSKSGRYYHDAEAVRERAKLSRPDHLERHLRGDIATLQRKDRGFPGQPDRQNCIGFVKASDPTGRNRRTTDFFFESLDALIADQRRYLRHLERVRDNGGMLLDEDGDPLALVFNTKGYAGAHYATFNPDMIEPLVKCSTSERGVCPKCGGPWERVTTRTFEPQGDVSLERGIRGAAGQKPMDESSGWEGVPRGTTQTTTLGWRPSCGCSGLTIIGDQPQKPSKRCDETETEFAARLALWRVKLNEWWQLWNDLKPLYDAEPTAPAIVADFFVGSGTVPMVARKLGRHGIGLDLSFDYLRDQARPRLELDKLAEWENGGQQVQAAWQELPLFAAQQAALELEAV